MNTDLARAEMIAAATPRDFVSDMNGAVCWNVCFHCNRCFIGLATRKVCALCSPGEPQDPLSLTKPER